MTRYTAFGLQIDSEFSLPSLLQSSKGSADVTVRLGDVPKNLSDPVGKGPYFEATRDSFLFRVTDTGLFLVVKGQEIIIERLPGCREDVLNTFLMGSAFGALMHQRGLLVMHASCVQTAQGAVLFVGPRTHGKSTLLAALVRRGYPMMGDDVTAIDAESSPVPVAFPSFPRMRLTADSATRTGYPLDSLPRVWHSGKYLVPVERFCADVLPVHAIFLLGVHEAPDIVSESVAASERFAIVGKNTYRYDFLEVLGLRQVHFRSAARLANTVHVRRITRPAAPFLLDELVDRLEVELGEPVDATREREVLDPGSGLGLAVPR